jgi:hypothetical protein
MAPGSSQIATAERGAPPSIGGDSLLASIQPDGTIVVPAPFVAAGLGVSIEFFLANLRAGLVFQTTEKGAAEDAGRLRLTFRCRGRQFRLVVDSAGRLVTTG